MALSRRIEGTSLIITGETGEELLTIREEMTGEREMTFFVEGDIRTELAPELEDELMALLAVGTSVAVDFSRTGFISAAGLKALLTAQQLVDDREGASFCVMNLSQAVTDTFEETGFMDLIEIKP